MRNLMINLEKGDIGVGNKDDYFHGLNLIHQNVKDGVNWESDKGKNILKLIEEINLYASKNFNEVNKVF